MMDYLRFYIKPRNIKLNIYRFFTGFLFIPGAIVTLYQLLIIFFPNFDVSDFCSNIYFLIAICIISLSFGVCFILPKRIASSTIVGTDVRVSCKICNLLSQNDDMVIAVNTTFDTSTEGDFVSPKSLQGQFQSKFFKNNLNYLDEIIDISLKAEKISAFLNDGRKTKTKEYEIGTVAKIFHKESLFRNSFHTYLLALAKANSAGVTTTTNEDFSLALYKLWNYLRINGHKTKLNIPLIGTGKSGLNCERMAVAKEIIFSFVSYAKSAKIVDELVVCVSMNDYEKCKMDLDELQEYLNVICKNDSLYKAEKDCYKNLSTPIS